MKIFNYWVKKTFEINKGTKKFNKIFYYGSNLSIEDADKKIELNKNTLIENFLEFTKKDRSKRNSVFREYDSNIVEPVIDNLSSDNIQAYITRNHYGAEVLCVDKLMFLDIDYANANFSEEFSPTHKKWDKFLKYFGIQNKSFKDKQAKIDLISNKVKVISQQFNTIHETEAKIIYVVQEFIKSKYTNLNFRVYRTRMGLRLIETTRLWNPKSEEVWSLMKDFMCDSVYMLFCLRQNCFRARLTPKPWRVKMEPPKIEYPFISEEDKAKYNDWVNLYNKNKELKNVSLYFCNLGNGNIDKIFNNLIEKHDNYHLLKDKPLG